MHSESMHALRLVHLTCQLCVILVVFTSWSHVVPLAFCLLCFCFSFCPSKHSLSLPLLDLLSPHPPLSVGVPQVLSLTASFPPSAFYFWHVQMVLSHFATISVLEGHRCTPLIPNHFFLSKLTSWPVSLMPVCTSSSQYNPSLFKSELLIPFTSLTTSFN